MKKILIVIVVLLCLVGIGFWMYTSALRPMSTGTVKKLNLVIPKGKGVSWVAQKLESEGLIHSALVFRLEARRTGLMNSLQAGSYTLNSSQSVQEMFTTLSKGTDDVWVTLLEGWRREQYADAFEQALGDSFDRATFLQLTQNKEGLLYPDTYLIPKSISTAQLVQLLTSTFDKKTKQQMERAKVALPNYTWNQIITMASIVEREAKTYPTMQQVAAILWKRVDLGWPLQADATLQYVKGYSATQKDWWTVPLAADKSIVSPYNTYSNVGLPPGPIANPSILAIQATVDRLETSYLFYITDQEGSMHYAKTLDEHNANVQKYLR